MSGIYLHIPFCDTKCIYCDFYSITNHSHKEEFIICLLKEIELRKNELAGRKFDTIFFGGGTPSLLSYEEFSRIFGKLYDTFDIDDNSEITIEANPGTLDKNKLLSFRSLPINRISFGVQSFINEELKFLSRIHDSRQAIEAIKTAQDVGYNNLNIDLMFALPNQTEINWRYNLEKAVRLSTQHISAYALIFEDGTFLNTLLHKGKVNKADEELETKLFSLTSEYFSANSFHQYEISNFARLHGQAKEGFECRHNLKYWTHQEYISFGPSASSFVSDTRWTNIKNLEQYISKLNKNELPVDFSESIDKETAISEFIFLGLRSKGIDLNAFQKIFHKNFSIEYKKPIEFLTSTGFAESSDSLFRLTRKGYAVCDEITASYF